MNIITLAHGSGGQQSHELVKKVFIDKFNNEMLGQMNDSSVINVGGSKIAYTTDSYVINPIFFPGGDIGRLAVCGTVNDLSMSGAKPLALSCGFIIEEGLDIEILEKITQSMVEACEEAGVKFATGDTKVVNRGAADKIFINTSGIGIIDEKVDIRGDRAQVGDKIIVSGSIGDHGATVMLSREEYGIQSDIKSDASPLNGLVEEMLKVTKDIHVLRDPTRGGLATTLNEIAEQSKVEIEINEETVLVKDNVKGICSLLGLDPMYLANEGKLIAIVPADKCDEILITMKKHKYGKDAAVVGQVKKVHEYGRVYMNTESGGTRIISKLVGDALPRIC